MPSHKGPSADWNKRENTCVGCQSILPGENARATIVLIRFWIGEPADTNQARVADPQMPFTIFEQRPNIRYSASRVVRGLFGVKRISVGRANSVCGEMADNNPAPYRAEPEGLP